MPRELTLDELEARKRQHEEWKRRNDEALKRAGVTDDGAVEWEGEDETVPPIVVSLDREGEILDVREFPSRAAAEASVRAFYRQRAARAQRRPRPPVARPRSRRPNVRSGPRRARAPSRSSDDSESPPVEPAPEPDPARMRDLARESGFEHIGELVENELGRLRGEA